MGERTPARRIVEAFGDCEALAAMYSTEIVWRLNHSLPANIAGPHIGKDAVCAFNDAVFNKIYDASSLRVHILDEIGNGTSSVVRFNLHATSRRGHSYDVEYVLFAKSSKGLVYEVVELLDTHASTEQHQGNAVGIPPS
ncbi:MAG: nuclear transport factor 2 family protein [Pseudomonadota bacterium]